MKKKLSISLLPGDGIGQEISIEAKKILNWVPETSLDKGLKLTYNYFKSIQNEI